MLRLYDYLASGNGYKVRLELQDGTCLAESNAILFYLADGTRLLPTDRLERAQVLQWMCFEQYSHEPNIATVRFWLHTELTDERRAALPAKRALGHAALAVMEGHLREREFLVGSRYTIADAALYAYTHVADEGGFDLAAYPAVRAWLARVAAEPGNVSITRRE